MAKKGPMEKHYDDKYYFSEKFGGKEYLDTDGKTKTFGYYGGGIWNFQGILNKLLGLLESPRTVLDIGSGCGGWVATLNNNHIPAVGLEFSSYAIEHAVMEAEKYLVEWDIENRPWPVEDKYTWVTAIDLFEHLFADRVDEVIAETKQRARRWIVAKICTAKKPSEVWVADRASYDEVYEQAKREGFEWLIVSGHVCSQTPDWWLEKFEDDKWRQRDDLSNTFTGDLNLPDDWRTTLILENTKWFEETFY